MHTGFSALFNDLPFRSFRSGRSLFYQGEIPRSAYIIRSGTIRAYDIGHTGEERTISFFTPGDLLPLGWISGQAPVSLYNYEAYDDVEVYYTDRDTLMNRIEQNPQIMKHVLKRTFSSYLGATMHIQALEQSRAQDKLIKILQYLSLTHGQKIDDHAVRISIRLTQQDLAQMVGITRETAATELGKLRRKGVISYQSFTYTLHNDKLQSSRLADEWHTVTLTA